MEQHKTILGFLATINFSHLVVLAIKIEHTIFRTLRLGLGLGILFFNNIVAQAQNSFSFLNIANNARINALGGVNISLIDRDINLFSFNPALLDSSQQGQIGLNFSPYLASSKFISLNYSPKFNNTLVKNWAVSLQNLNYGTFQGTDAVGNLTNEFSANDFAFTAMSSRNPITSAGVSAILVARDTSE